MSDAQVRELERRWRATGAPEDQAAWILARVRTGELRIERIELAALCGEAGARAALVALRGAGADPVASGAIPPPEDLGRFLQALDARDPLACARAALELARCVVAADPSPGADPEVEAALTAAEAVLVDPSPLRGADAAHAADALRTRAEPRAWAALRAATAAARVVGAPRLRGEWNERVGEDAFDLAFHTWVAGLPQLPILRRVQAQVAAWAIGAIAA